MNDITGVKDMNPKRYPLHHDHGTVTISRDVFETMSKELERLRPMETGLELTEADRDAYRKRVDDLKKAQGMRRKAAKWRLNSCVIQRAYKRTLFPDGCCALGQHL